MPVYFNTKNIDEHQYKRFIEWFLYNTTGKWDKNWDRWSITLFSSIDAPNDPFFDGQRGIGGITGLYTMKLYVNDSNNNMMFMENAMMISHELSHMLLIHYGYNQKVSLRNDDWSGHKKGARLNYSTAEVHDRHVEKKFRTDKIWYGVKKPWKFINVIVLDLRDIFGKT